MLNSPLFLNSTIEMRAKEYRYTFNFEKIVFLFRIRFMIVGGGKIKENF